MRTLVVAVLTAPFYQDLWSPSDLFKYCQPTGSFVLVI